jgi:hypothetical protein
MLPILQTLYPPTSLILIGKKLYKILLEPTQKTSQYPMVGSVFGWNSFFANRKARTDFPTNVSIEGIITVKKITLPPTNTQRKEDCPSGSSTYILRLKKVRIQNK